jgi:hypothetical protein
MAAPDPAAVADLARRLGEAMAAPGATAADVAALAGGTVADDGAPLGVRAEADLPGVEGVSVTRRWESEEPNAADIALAEPVELARLEDLLGAARPLPQSPGKPGEQRVVLGGDEERWAVLAALDGGGAVRAVTVRRDT